MWRPSEPHTNNERWWTVANAGDVEAAEKSISQYMQAEGLQALERTRTIEGIVEFCRTRSEFGRYLPLSWALHFLGRSAEAKIIVETAIQNAPHKNARESAQAWLARLGA
jgi:hypothetical protein